ncbi:ankyrin repeat and protein kinase domain-containing protein 1 [Salarias fasciatus]|uniref:Protein kinase domain-containing protein n=1 Tax=Salarias fasciatus TaxID=181472 RepID=A0A672HE61_SALFA|nr:ankyrin repeat and protein kinase domain-containing protein 1 [Salarias fasciatus]
MNCLDGSPGQFADFRKDDFEADWIKVAECRFGQVYQVKLKLWREKCALKSFDNDFYRRIKNEVFNIAKLKFKYIISIYGLCSEATAVVMEYMTNGSLNGLLASHTLMWPKKFQMIHEISMGMNFLHSMKPALLHLNLKTSNILLDDHLHVKISDFGLIHWEQSRSETFTERLTARGNISYIPPETFTQCSSPPGTSFDVYSFGIVIWEILAQQKPYLGCSLTTVLLQVSEGKRPCEKKIPEPRPSECEQMIVAMKHCWNQDPRKRPPFSDMVRRTEALSEIMKIPGPMHSHDDDVRQKLDHLPLTSPIVVPVFSSDERHSKDGLLSMLNKKDFCSFRQSLKKEHVSKQFSGNRSILHFTVESGDLETVRHVLSLGAKVNCATARGYTPLIIAVLHRFHDIASLLLDHGAAATQGDDDNWTPLHFAAQNGDSKTVRLLLDRGAEADVQENAGWMPLHLACQNGHETVVRLLLLRLSGETVMERREAQGRTPLHLASAYGHVDIVKLLLSQGSDPNATSKSLSTALHMSAEQGHNRIVRRLLKSGASTDCADSKGYTPLHLAALKGHVGISRHLLSTGANPDSRTLQGWTPMHLAALKGHEAAVALLEAHGGCVNAKGENGWTPLHVACHHSYPEVVLKLLAGQADPNLTEDTQGWTPLHLACNAVSFPSVLQLISYHADVNAVTTAKATPLHLAARHGCTPIVQALLLNGADRKLQDSSGSTALQIAQSCEKWETVKELEKDNRN